MAEVRVGGVFVSDVGQVSDLKWVHRWPGGNWEASWSLVPHAGQPLGLLRPGALVEIYEDLVCVWRGRLREPLRGDVWECHARGLGRRAEQFLALDSGTFLPTTNPGSALARAQTDGLGWAGGDAPLPVLPPGETVEFNTLAQLLDAAAEKVGMRWGVFADGRLTVAADPTTPTIMIDPMGAPEVGTALDGFASHAYGRYVSAMSGDPVAPSAWGVEPAANAPAAERWDRVEIPLDLTGLGMISDELAQEITAARLAEHSTQLGLTEPVEGTPITLTTLGDITPHFVFIGAFGPIAMRLQGVLDAVRGLNASQVLDVPVGEVSYADKSGQITLSPVGMVPRTHQEVTKLALRRGHRPIQEAAMNG